MINTFNYDNHITMYDNMSNMKGYAAMKPTFNGGSHVLIWIIVFFKNTSYAWHMLIVI
jgi:hypothetical protein